MNNYNRQYTWRTLKKQTSPETSKKAKLNFTKHFKPRIRSFSIAIIVIIGIICLNFIYSAVSSQKMVEVKPQKKDIVTVSKIDEQPETPKFSDIEIKSILANQNFLNSEEKNFFVTIEHETYKIVTSLNIPLQQFLIKKLDRLKQLNRGKPQRIAIVVMEPSSGKILALTGFDLLNPDVNPCFKNDFPAASIFKIITAAAAVEELGFTQYTPLSFNGSKYTLYKNQLKNTKNKYTTQIPFNTAFAESINPVFGKIGRNRLKNSILEKYADKFEFNKDIDSELIFEPGKIEITENPYKWAEIGSGFNRTTTISPIFGAMIASTIINDGKRAAPSIIEKIVDSQNDIIYSKENITLNEVINKKTALIVQALMQKTIEAGTARKTFRGYNRDKILSKLVIGGKTGSIYNSEHTIKYDWFTGFAKKKQDTTNKEINKIVVSIVVGHGKYIGTRAGSYGKMIIQEYYKNI